MKAVVDAYDGTVTMYLSDTLYRRQAGSDHPGLRQGVPRSVRDRDPRNLVAHFRYPEALFKAQTPVWGRYHQSDPATFFTNSDRWDIAQQPPDSSDPAAAAAAVGDQSTSQLQRIHPYYQQMQLGPDGESEFVLTDPVRAGVEQRHVRNLTSVMIARNDPGSYGELQQIEMVSQNSDGSSGPTTPTSTVRSRRTTRW